MRKLVLTVLLAASFTGVFAQKLDDVKEKLDKQKFGEAKEKIDKVLADPKNQSSSDAWFYKARTYYGLAKTDPTALNEALEAMKKYLALEESKPEKQRMLMATLEGNATFFNIYSDFFKAGVQNFKDQKYEAALATFKSTLDAFDVLSKYKIVTDVKFDTTSTIYAGFAAQNAKQYDQAAYYYDRMVQEKIRDTGYVDAYRFLINYNLEQKKDTATATKYLEISESAFPSYTDLWLDYELMMMGKDRAKKMARYQVLTERYPSNAFVALNYAIELYNNTFFAETKSPTYVADQEASRKALEKALTLDPNSEHGNFVMSQFYVMQTYDLDDSLRAIKGTTPADVAKRKELNARMDSKYETMYTYSQKAYDLFSAHEATMKAQDKANYRKVINQLIDYYSRKKQTDKVTFYQDKLKQLK